MTKELERIEHLRSEIKKHDILYDENRPEITDGEYDELYLELERLEKAFPKSYDPESPTQKIVVSTISKLDKVTHSTPMLSQDKVNNIEGVLEFIKRANDDILVQEKLDGITVVLEYRSGRLFQAASRGNGEIGEDITHTVKCFSNVPKVIPFKQNLEVRLEAIIPYEDFDRVNANGEYSNPRNLASGKIRKLDNEGIRELGLKAIAFDVVSAESNSFLKDIERLDFLREQGFEVVETVLFKKEDAGGIEGFIKNYEEKVRGTLPHMIDGLVLKFNSMSTRDRLGVTSKHPKWAVAYKFKSLDATTRLNDITWQVGKQGQITPVAELEIVAIDNVNISRATLHNYNNIVTKDIRIGDTVIVKRANDVIPFIVGSVPSLRDGSEIVVEAPEYCPSCGEKTEFDGGNLFCIGLNCVPQLEGKIKHFAKRDAMNIDSLGDKAVETFIKEGLIKSVVDIYRLKDKKDEICQLEGFGEKKFNKLIEGIDASKDVDLNRFIYSLAIKNIGRSASKDLAVEFGNIDSLLTAFDDLESFKKRLLSIPDFGDIMTNNLVHFLMHKKNIDTIRELKAYGVSVKIKEVEEVKESNITGKTFVVTGKVFKFNNREELSKKIESLGGKVAKKVSKKTDYLINNDNTSSTSKNLDAQKLNIPIITEDEAIEMMH